MMWKYIAVLFSLLLSLKESHGDGGCKDSDGYTFPYVSCFPANDNCQPSGYGRCDLTPDYKCCLDDRCFTNDINPIDGTKCVNETTCAFGLYSGSGSCRSNFICCNADPPTIPTVKCSLLGLPHFNFLEGICLEKCTLLNIPVTPIGGPCPQGLKCCLPNGLIGG